MDLSLGTGRLFARPSPAQLLRKSQSNFPQNAHVNQIVKEASSSEEFSSVKVEGESSGHEIVHPELLHPNSQNDSIIHASKQADDGTDGTVHAICKQLQFQSRISVDKTVITRLSAHTPPDLAPTSNHLAALANQTSISETPDILQIGKLHSVPETIEDEEVGFLESGSGRPHSVDDSEISMETVFPPTCSTTPNSLIGSGKSDDVVGEGVVLWKRGDDSAECEKGSIDGHCEEADSAVLMWLRSRGWSRYEPTFAVNMVRCEEMCDLSDSELEDMGIDDESHRRLILAAAQADGPDVWSRRKTAVEIKSLTNKISPACSQEISLPKVWIPDRNGKNKTNETDKISEYALNGNVTWCTDPHGDERCQWRRGWVETGQDGVLRVYRTSCKRCAPFRTINLKEAVIVESPHVADAITIQADLVGLGNEYIHLAFAGTSQRELWLHGLLLASARQANQDEDSVEGETLLLLVDEIVIPRSNPMFGGHLTARLEDVSGNSCKAWPIPILAFCPSDLAILRCKFSSTHDERVGLEAQLGTGIIQSYPFVSSLHDTIDGERSLFTTCPDDHGIIRAQFSTDGNQKGLLISRALRRSAGRNARLVIEVRRTLQLNGKSKGFLIAETKYWSEILLEFLKEGRCSFQLFKPPISSLSKTSGGLSWLRRGREIKKGGSLSVRIRVQTATSSSTLRSEPATALEAATPLLVWLRRRAETESNHENLMKELVNLEESLRSSTDDLLHLESVCEALRSAVSSKDSFPQSFAEATVACSRNSVACPKQEPTSPPPSKSNEIARKLAKLVNEELSAATTEAHSVAAAAANDSGDLGDIAPFWGRCYGSNMKTSEKKDGFEGWVTYVEPRSSYFFAWGNSDEETGTKKFGVRRGNSLTLYNESTTKMGASEETIRVCLDGMSIQRSTQRRFAVELTKNLMGAWGSRGDFMIVLESAVEADEWLTQDIDSCYFFHSTKLIKRLQLLAGSLWNSVHTTAAEFRILSSPSPPPSHLLNTPGLDMAQHVARDEPMVGHLMLELLFVELPDAKNWKVNSTKLAIEAVASISGRRQIDQLTSVSMAPANPNQSANQLGFVDGVVRVVLCDDVLEATDTAIYFKLWLNKNQKESLQAWSFASLAVLRARVGSSPLRLRMYAKPTVYGAAASRADAVPNFALSFRVF